MFSQSSPAVVLSERSLSADAKQQVRTRVTSGSHGVGCLGSQWCVSACTVEHADNAHTVQQSV